MPYNIFEIITLCYNMKRVGLLVEKDQKFLIFLRFIRSEQLQLKGKDSRN